MKVINLSAKKYDAGTYARIPTHTIQVTFDDGEQVDVDVDNGDPKALGLCYWDGQNKQSYGRLAEAACFDR